MNLDELTAREREIFALAASGVANADIAKELGITENAVRYHLKEIHSKLETGGQRSFLRWHRLRALAPGALLGSRAASAVATSAVFGVAGVLAVGAVLARPGDDQVRDGAHPCPTAFSFMPGTTFEEIARVGDMSVADIQALNPGLTEEQLASGFNEVNVGSMDHAECGQATETVAGATSLGGTPQAGPSVGGPIPTITAVSGTYACPTAYGSWPGSTFDDFASIGQKSVEEIRALNPGLTEAQLAAGSVEVNVGERENGQCAEVIPTTPAGATSVGGTPQAGP